MVMSRYPRVVKFSVFAAVIAFASSRSQAQDAPSPQQHVLSRAEAALVVAEHFHLTHTEDPTTLHGLVETAFPGGYDGLTTLSFHDQPTTWEVMTVVLVWNAGWDVVHYSEALAAEVRPFVTPEGYPFYGPDPTPRSIPFVCVAIERGLIERSDLARLRSGMTRTDIDTLFRRFDAISSTVRPIEPFVYAPANASASDLADVVTDGRQILVLRPGLQQRGRLWSDSFKNPVLDLRGPNPRLILGPSDLGHGGQDYFPLGALQTTFTTALTVPAEALYHQGQAFYGTVDNYSATVNAIGVWGASRSRARGARVWGGFLTATSGDGDATDGQLVGLEVDITNHTLPGVSPNESKVGIQVVGLGTAGNTNAVEVIAADRGQWINGLLFAPRSVSADGAYVATAQNDPVRVGIDFSYGRFNQAAIALPANGRIQFATPGGPPAAVYSDEFFGGGLVLQGGPAGVRVTNAANTKNLVWIHDDGSLDPRSRILRRYRWIGWVALGLVGFVAISFGLLVNAFLRLRREVASLRSLIEQPTSAQ